MTGDWQKFKGLPGAEGTLKVAEPRPDKQAIFAAALAAAGEEPVTEATTPKKKGKKSSDAAKPSESKPGEDKAEAEA